MMPQGLCVYMQGEKVGFHRRISSLAHDFLRDKASIGFDFTPL